jgi:hypothetical protein
MDQEFWAEHAGRDLSNAVYLICIALVPAFMFCLYHKDLAFHCHCIWGLPWLWSYGIIAKRQTIQWPKDRQYNDKKTDNTMTKRQSIQWPKDGQYNDQKTVNTMTKRQTIQWPKDRQYNDQKTDNTMTKRQSIQWPKDSQYNDQKERDKQRSIKH